MQWYFSCTYLISQGRTQVINGSYTHLNSEEHEKTKKNKAQPLDNVGSAGYHHRDVGDEHDRILSAVFALNAEFGKRSSTDVL